MAIAVKIGFGFASDESREEFICNHHEVRLRSHGTNLLPLKVPTVMSHELFEIDARNPKMLTHIWNLCSIWLKTFLRDDRGSSYSGSSNYKWIGNRSTRQY